jgi:insertion element IS1 protein InsB
VPPLRYDSLELDELVVRFRWKRRYRYLWLAVSRLTRQVLAYVLGDRSRRSGRRLWQQIPAAYRRKLVYTDDYHVYAAVLRPWQHRPSPKGSGRTSVIEGLNNKWRNRIAGLVRKTVCVQSMVDLERRLQVVFAEHNRQCQQRVEKLGWLRLSTH